MNLEIIKRSRSREKAEGLFSAISETGEKSKVCNFTHYFPNLIAYVTSRFTLMSRGTLIPFNEIIFQNNVIINASNIEKSTIFDETIA